MITPNQNAVPDSDPLAQESKPGTGPVLSEDQRLGKEAEDAPVESSGQDIEESDDEDDNK